MPLIVLGFCSDSTSPRAHSYYYNLPPLHVAVDHAAREQLEQRDRPGRRSCSDWPGPHHRGSQRAKDGGWRPRRRSDCQVLGLEVSERSERALRKRDYEPLLNQTNSRLFRSAQEEGHGQSRHGQPFLPNSLVHRLPVREIPGHSLRDVLRRSEGAGRSCPPGHGSGWRFPRG